MNIYISATFTLFFGPNYTGFTSAPLLPYFLDPSMKIYSIATFNLFFGP